MAAARARARLPAETLEPSDGERVEQRPLVGEMAAWRGVADPHLARALWELSERLTGIGSPLTPATAGS